MLVIVLFIVLVLTGPVLSPLVFVLSFATQEKVVPLILAVKVRLRATPSQMLAEFALVTTGDGLTVMLKVCAGPVQPEKFAVALKLATTGVVPTLTIGVAAMFVVPDPAIPIDGVEFVQLIAEPPIDEVKTIAAELAPAQSTWLLIGKSVGNGAIVVGTLKFAEQLFASVIVTE